MGAKARHRSSGLFIAVISAAVIALLMLFLTHIGSISKMRASGLEQKSVPALEDSEWKLVLATSKVHVSAVVFYGRRRYVRILDKYIKRNLVSAGGLLEEVLACSCCSSCSVPHDSVAPCQSS